MSNQFLQDFANLHIKFQPESRSVTEPYAQRELEVLKAMMEKVKLNKDNYMSLMKGLKVFIDCPAT